MDRQVKRLSAVESAASSFGMKSLSGQISACKDLISRNAYLNVAVVGKFKAGKSSFLNCLAGREILPVGVIPVTSVITELYWDTAEGARVKFLDGKTKDIPLKEVSVYIDERNNQENKFRVDSVSIGLPEMKDWKRLKFVDTPGLESVLTHNTKTSLEWISNTGLAIIAVSADSPLSEHDIELISAMRSYSPEIIVLLTKTDRMDSSELSQVVDFIRNKLRERFKIEMTVYPFSVRPEFSALRAAFTEKILKPFAANIEEERARILEHKLSSLERKAKEYLLAAMAASRAKDDERARLENLVIKHKERFNLLQNNFKSLFERDAAQMRSRLERSFLAHSKRVVTELEAILEKKLSSPGLNLAQMSGVYSDVMNEFFSNQTKNLFAFESRNLQAAADKSAESFVKMSEDFISLLIKDVQDVLGVKLPFINFESKPAKLPEPDVKISQAFETHIELLWFFIPSFLFRRMFIRHFLSLVPFETEKNIIRMAMSIASDVNNNTDRARQAALQHVKDTLDAIERILAEKPDSTGRIEAALKSLEA